MRVCTGWTAETRAQSAVRVETPVFLPHAKHEASSPPPAQGPNCCWFEGRGYCKKGMSREKSLEDEEVHNDDTLIFARAPDLLTSVFLCTNLIIYSCTPQESCPNRYIYRVIYNMIQQYYKNSNPIVALRRYGTQLCTLLSPSTALTDGVLTRTVLGISQSSERPHANSERCLWGIIPRPHVSVTVDCIRYFTTPV